MKRAVLVAALLFACGCGGPPEPENPALPRTESCEARANARHQAERARGSAVEPELMSASDPVLETLADRLVRCRGYDSHIDACAVMQARVSRDGVVTSSEPYVSESLPDDVLYCLADVLRSTRFGAAERERTLLVPVTFAPSRRWAR